MSEGLAQPQDTPPSVRGAAEFSAAIHWSVCSAIAAGARRILWVDNDFADWPLNDATLLDPLHDWLMQPQRRLQLLALSYELMPQRYARFVAWRRDRSHVVDMLAPPEDESIALPTLAVDDGRVSVRLFDRVHWRGRCSLDAPDASRIHEQFDALLQRSGPGFPVTQLGL